jgi:hypothetical protein
VPERSADLRRLDQIKDRPIGARLGRRESASGGGCRQSGRLKGLGNATQDNTGSVEMMRVGIIPGRMIVRVRGSFMPIPVERYGLTVLMLVLMMTLVVAVLDLKTAEVSKGHP